MSLAHAPCMGLNPSQASPTRCWNSDELPTAAKLLLVLVCSSCVSLCPRSRFSCSCWRGSLLLRILSSNGPLYCTPEILMYRLLATSQWRNDSGPLCFCCCCCCPPLLLFRLLLPILSMILVRSPTLLNWQIMSRDIFCDVGARGRVGACSRKIRWPRGETLKEVDERCHCGQTGGRTTNTVLSVSHCSTGWPMWSRTILCEETLLTNHWQ